MMYFSTLPRAYKCRDFVNLLFMRQGINKPMVKVEKTTGGFRVVACDPKIHMTMDRKRENPTVDKVI